MSAVTDAILEDIADGQNRPLEAVYPLVFFDALDAKLRRAACTRGPFRTDEAAMKPRFLNALKREVLAGKVVQAILDNHAAHKTPEVRRWLARHPRWTFHFPSTSSSWLNAFEGGFAKLARRRFKRGVFRSVVDFRPPSIASSTNTTKRRSPLSGPPTPTSSSPLAPEGSMRYD